MKMRPMQKAGRLICSVSPTSFVAIKDSKLCGFLIGFFLQTYPNEGYIHFAGVHPNYRKVGLARRLYHTFYNACLDDSRNIIRSCTAPINTLLINFHTKMGFSIEPGSSEIEGVPITTGYRSDTDQKVLFKKILNPR